MDRQRGHRQRLRNPRITGVERRVFWGRAEKQAAFIGAGSVGFDPTVCGLLTRFGLLTRSGLLVHGVPHEILGIAPKAALGGEVKPVARIIPRPGHNAASKTGALRFFASR
jgi:hypothetical protein